MSRLTWITEKEIGRERKNKRDKFRNTAAASKVKVSGSEKETVQEHKQQFFARTYDISSVKGISRKFHVVVVQQQRQRNVQKSVLHVQSYFFAN